MTIAFYVSAVVAILATIMVITRYNAVHALLYLVVSLLSVAIIFYLLGAPFAAALEVIIYAGAILVLFIFVVMMLHLGDRSVQQEKEWQRLSMWAGPSLLTLILLGEISYLIFTQDLNSTAGAVVNAKAIGIALYGPYLIGVELAAILLMAGIVGAYHLGRETKTVKHRYLQNDNTNG